MIDSPGQVEGAGLGERSAGYLRLLVVLLLPAAFFNSYDGELRAVLLSQLKSSFHAGTAAVGVANVPIGAGQFVAFFAVLWADRIGRRPILLWSIAGYTVFTTLSAASWNLWSFAAFQFAAQVFIGTEFGVAVTLLAEEVPAERRGRFISWLLLVSPLGAAMAGGLVAAGFLHNPLGWRAFYLVAAIPLLVAAVARRRLQESRAYQAAVRHRPPSPRPQVRKTIVAALRLWSGPHRGRAAALGAIAFLQGVVAAGAVGWWTYYAEHERHLATTTAGVYFAAAALVSVVGYLLCGDLIDRIGRRPAASLYVGAAVVCGVAAFQVHGHWLMLLLLLGTAFFGVGVTPALAAFAAELFPTEVRAQASAWIRNGLGSAGSVIGPTMVGLLGSSGGPIGNIGDAVTLLALLYLIVLPIVWCCIPETRRISLIYGQGRKQ
jgi:putative MFS transporter